MLSYEEFRELLEDVIDEQPEYCFRDLNGGVILEEELKRNPAAKADDLFILGTYSRGGYMGRYVTIFYGSFCRVFGHLSPEEMKEKIRHTLRHELTHHLESLAGERDLEIEDEQFMEAYMRRYEEKQNQ